MGAVPCTACGHGISATAKFCEECGASAQPLRPAERKQVTVLFGDVVGSMKLAATLDPERLREIMYDLFNRSALIVQRYGGTVDKFTGDGLMALFGAPAALEDHALRAAIAALEMHIAAAQLAETVREKYDVDLQIRIGLNSGEVITGDIGSSFTAIGHPVGIAQRMEAAAPSGGTLCSASTAALVESTAALGPPENVVVKNESAPVEARRLLGVTTEQRPMGRQSGAMLGRDSELHNLQTAFAEAEKRGLLVGVVGSAGVGKSRLVAEFSSAAQDSGADPVVARCESHTAGVPLQALARLLRALFGVVRLDDAAARDRITGQLGAFMASDSEHARVLFELLGVAETGTAATVLTPDAVRRRLVEVMATAVKARPSRTVLIIEDIHWIDEASAEVLVDFTSALAATQSMLVVTYRPDYQGGLRGTCEVSITLRPLSDSTTHDLAAGLIGEHPTTRGVADLIAAPAAGNPFFVEEIIRDLTGRGILTGSRGAYQLASELADIDVPATVQAVLAARIDRLPAPAKAIINAAAVIGSRFDLDILRALVPGAEPVDLEELIAGELIDQTEFLPQPVYVFRHPLVRTVAYESQLTATRTAAHKRLAEAIQQRDPDALDENAALIAAQLQAAGELDQAYRWHMRAADWLQTRSIFAARLSWQHARRISDCLPEGTYTVAMRTAPRTMLARTAYQGDAADAEHIYAELLALTAQSGDLVSRAVGMAGQMILVSQSRSRLREATAMSHELVAILDRMDGHERIKYLIYQAVVWTQFLVGSLGEALGNAERQRRFEAAGDPRTRAFSIATVGLIEIVSGEHLQGRAHLREATKYIRVSTDAVNQAQIASYWASLTGIGFEIADDFVPLAREAVLVAEELGDTFGCACAWYALGTVLVRVGGHDTEAADLLTKARAAITRHSNPSLFLPAIDTDLATCTARAGDVDAAVERLRTAFETYFATATPYMGVLPAAALVDLLVSRGADDDLGEAESVVAEMANVSSRLGDTVMTMVTLGATAQLARARGDRAGYAETAKRYLQAAERFDARGRLPDARRMVAEIT